MLGGAAGRAGAGRAGDVEGPPPGVRVVVDVRPLQEPEHAPVTAAYLGRLLGAFAAEPLEGESFVLLLRADLPDPMPSLAGLPIAGRRFLPATRFLRTATPAVDPFVLRGASVGTGRGARRAGANGAVHHAAGTVLPFAPGLPVVASLLDLAPWQLAGTFQRSPAARFAARLRLRLLRGSRIVACGSGAVADLAARRLRVPADRLRVVPLAARDAFRASPGTDPGATRAELERLGLSGRYLVWSARHDARQDLPTLLAALRALASAGRPADLPAEDTWPPRVLVVEAAPADRTALARAAARAGVADAFAYAPGLPPERLAILVAAARAGLAPVVSEAAGLATIEAIAAGVPVVASAVGALPELVGRAGILVPPRSPERLASALRAIVTDDALRASLAGEAAARGLGRRSWGDVALEIRRLYAEAAGAGTP
ncbi:MAG TPA: glycosyltransferase [Candidatus Limnocylindrales bacterium]|nr:glycosyltransferase [Candidatus Limnocylindrales bacterium]